MHDIFLFAIHQVSKEKAIADEEEQKVQVINVEVTKKQQDCERDLAKAEPALKAAQEALDTLNKVNIYKGEGKTYCFVSVYPVPDRFRDSFTIEMVSDHIVILLSWTTLLMYFVYVPIFCF